MKRGEVLPKGSIYELEFGYTGVIGNSEPRFKKEKYIML